jgi:hypothetical protein
MDQKNINENLEQVFDLEPSRENIQDQPVTVKKGRYANKAPSRGGKREGGGRKPGTTNKISGVSILNAIQKEIGKPFEQLLAEGYHQTIVENDMMSRQKYEQMFLSKVVADKHEIDHTTLGESLKANFNFQNKELPDWTQVPTTFKVK